MSLNLVWAISLGLRYMLVTKRETLALEMRKAFVVPESLLTATRYKYRPFPSLSFYGFMIRVMLIHDA